MLEKMGWKEGEGLGREGEGRREPVSTQFNRRKLTQMAKIRLGMAQVSASIQLHSQLSSQFAVKSFAKGDLFKGNLKCSQSNINFLCHTALRGFKVVDLIHLSLNSFC